MLKNIVNLLFSVIIIVGITSCGGGSENKTIYNEVDFQSYTVQFLEPGKVKIDWDDVKGAEYYKVKYFEFDDFLYSNDLPYVTVTESSITLDGLSEGEWFLSVLPRTGKQWSSPTFDLTATSAIMYDNPNQVSGDESSTNEDTYKKES